MTSMTPQPQATQVADTPAQGLPAPVTIPVNERPSINDHPLMQKLNKAKTTSFIPVTVDGPVKLATQDTTVSVPAEPSVVVPTTPQTQDKNEVPNTDNDSNNTQKHDWKKRYTDAKTFIEDQGNIIKELQDQLKVTQTKSKELPVNQEAIDEWVKKNPDLATMITTLARVEQSDTTIELEAAKKELERIKQETNNAKIFGEVLKAHPDADDIRKSPDFAEWFNDQTSTVKALIESTVVADIVKGINIYKLETGKLTPAKPKEEDTNKSAQAAMAVQTGASSVQHNPGAKIWKASDLRKLTPSQYAKVRDEVKQARLEGRFDSTS